MKAVKYCLAVILLLTINEITYGQPKWTIGVNASPALTKLAGNYEYEQFSLAYGAGFSSLYFINDRMFLRTGLNYKNKSSLEKTPYALILLLPNNEYTYIDPNNNPYYIKMNSMYFSVPLTLNYKISKEKEGKDNASFFISAGLELNYQFRNAFKFHLINEKMTFKYVYDFIDRGHFVGSLVLGFGIYQQISSKISLLLRPEYTYDFHYRGFHSIGFNVELHYKLK